MSLASVIHHGIFAPAKSDRIFLTIPVLPPDFRARGWTESRFSLVSGPPSLFHTIAFSFVFVEGFIYLGHANVILVSAANRRLSHLPPIACSREIDQEDDVSSSGDCFFSKILFFTLNCL